MLKFVAWTRPLRSAARGRAADSRAATASGVPQTTGLSRRGGRACVSVMQVVGRRHVDHVDIRVVEHRLEARVGGRQAELPTARRGAFLARSDDAVHLDAQAAQSLHVDGADETGADDRGADLGERPHLGAITGTSLAGSYRSASKAYRS